MAQVVKTIVTDDISGTEGAQTVHFGLDGVQYEIDLTPEHEAQLRDALTEFVAHARKVRGSGPRKRQYVKASGQRMAEIREWARANGYEVADRGRIPAAILDHYNAAGVTASVATLKRDGLDLIVAPEGTGKSKVLAVVEGETDAVKSAEQLGGEVVGNLVVEKASRVKTNRNSTRAVFTNLFKEGGMWTSVGERMRADLTARDVFVDRAKSWLSDKSNLSLKTLDTADWDEVYEHFKGLRSDKQDAAEKSNTGTPKRATGRKRSTTQNASNES